MRTKRLPGVPPGICSPCPVRRNVESLSTPAGPTADGAGVGDDAALAVAVGAGAGGHELAEDRLLHLAHLAGPAADGADRRLLAVAHAAAVARLANLPPVDVGVFLGPGDGFLEGQLDGGLQIGTAHWCAWATA